jgi:bifunctional DNA-binding transcriptional regulator/antitoxin component of YhaV-PrlF toxin-antitoxin module
VVIPAEIVDELGIREKQKLVLRRSGKKIVVGGLGAVEVGDDAVFSALFRK